MVEFAPGGWDALDAKAGRVRRCEVDQDVSRSLVHNEGYIAAGAFDAQVFHLAEQHGDDVVEAVVSG